MGRSELDQGAEGTEESVPERGTWCVQRSYGGRSVSSLGTWKLAGVAEGRKGGGGDKKAS